MLLLMLMMIVMMVVMMRVNDGLFLIKVLTMVMQWGWTGSGEGRHGHCFSCCSCYSNGRDIGKHRGCWGRRRR